MSGNKSSIGELMTRLITWYKGECNGDWEHSYGINIDTLDNPGWLVKVDLAETDWKDLCLPRVITEIDESDWHQYEVVNSKFIGACSVDNLGQVIESFFCVVGRQAGS